MMKKETQHIQHFINIFHNFNPGGA